MIHSIARIFTSRWIWSQETYKKKSEIFLAEKTTAYSITFIEVLSLSRSDESKGGQTQSSESNSSGLPFRRFNVNCDFFKIYKVQNKTKNSEQFLMIKTNTTDFDFGDRSQRRIGG